MAISQVCAMKVNGTLYNSVPPNAKASGAGGNGGAAGNALSGNPLVSWPSGFGTIFGNRV